MNEFVLKFIWPILLRDGLKIAGAALGSTGYVTGGQWELLSGAFVTIGSVLWSIYKGTSVTSIIGKAEAVPDVAGINVTSTKLADKFGQKVQSVVGTGYNPEGPGGTQGVQA